MSARLGVKLARAVRRVLWPSPVPLPQHPLMPTFQAPNCVSVRNYAKKADFAKVSAEGDAAKAAAKAEMPAAADTAARLSAERTKFVEQYKQLYGTLDRQEAARDAWTGDFYKLTSRQQEALRAVAKAHESALAPVRLIFSN